MKRVFITGGGLMGQGIAIEMARGGCDVTIYDVSEKALKNARKMIQTTLEELEKLGIAKDISATLNRIDYRQNLDDLANSDLVLEAVTEELSVKASVLQELERYVGDDIPICSNTSVICINDLARYLTVKERFLGLHWMNPPYIMPLVEIVRSDFTSDSIISSIKDLLETRLSKKTIVCRNQSIVNRFNAAVLAEATRIIRDDELSFEDIDNVWKYHLGILYTLFGPMGNLDYIGLETVLAASMYLYERFKEEKFKPSEWLLEKVRRGEVGIKASKGIYEYNRSFEEMYLSRVISILELLKFLKLEDRNGP
jgi:3-hydroxyacyl-CoA dehydrogenase